MNNIFSKNFEKLKNAFKRINRGQSNIEHEEIEKKNSHMDEIITKEDNRALKENILIESEINLLEAANDHRLKDNFLNNKNLEVKTPFETHWWDNDKSYSSGRKLKPYQIIILNNTDEIVNFNSNIKLKNKILDYYLKLWT